MGWTDEEEDVARERIQRAASASSFGTCLRLPDKCFRPYKIRQTYAILAIICLAGVAGVLNAFLNKYWPNRPVIGFVGVSCRTVSTEVTRNNLTCTCGLDCTARYDCLTVRTMYDPLVGPNITSTLYATMADLEHPESYLRCSYHPPCGSRHFDAQRQLENFKRVITAPGESYDCFYNPNQPEVVIQHRDVDLQQMAALLIGSGAVAALGLLGCIFVASMCGCAYVFTCSAPADVVREAEVRLTETEAMKKKPTPIKTEHV